MKQRGRPVNSQIRQNIIEILFHKGKSYGYDLYKYYVEIFPKVTMRSIYYHLKKGITLNEFEIDEIIREKGDYSWGPSAEKIYYKLGTNANPKGDLRVKSYFDSIKQIE
jgi:hypothetical protein